MLKKTGTSNVKTTRIKWESRWKQWYDKSKNTIAQSRHSGMCGTLKFAAVLKFVAFFNFAFSILRKKLWQYLRCVIIIAKFEEF